MPTITIQLPTMHRAQATIFTDKARFRVAACGRRFGKSATGFFDCIAAAAQGGLVWWICPAYSQVTPLWMEFKQLIRGFPVTIREADRMVIFNQTGGCIMFKTADNPDMLVGAGLDLAVLDEAPLMKQSTWYDSIRPALSDKRGRALFLFSPKGIGNWTYKLYGYGLDPNLPNWSSYRFPTSANPLIPADEIEQARQDLPERVFREMYLAEFISDSDGVFRGILDACTAKPQAQRTDHAYAFGLDWGRSNDFTVISVIDQVTMTEVQLDRFTEVGYSVQRDRIKVLFEKWKPFTILAETNSIGGPNIEALQAEGLPVRPFDTTNASKEQIINGLALAIERKSQGIRGGVTLLDHPVGISELQSYEADRLPSGKWRFGARSGAHDDTVIARALAVKAAGSRTMPAIAFDWDGTIDPDSAAAIERWKRGE